MLGYPAVALLDRDGVYGAPRFHKAALAAGLRPIIGAELTIETRRETGAGRRESKNPPGKPFPTPDSRLPSSRIHAPRPGLVPRGLAQSLSSADADEAARAERRGRARRSRSSTATPRAWSRLPGRPLLHAERYGVGGLLDRLVGIFGRAQRLRRAAAASAARRGSRQRGADRAGRGVSRAGRRHQRRALRRRRPSGRCSTCSPASTTTPRWTRPAAGWRATPSAI